MPTRCSSGSGRIVSWRAMPGLAGLCRWPAADTGESDMNPMHEANRRGWDAASAGWQATVERDVDWRRCPADPAVALIEEELELLADVAGRDVCVLGSGDNLAVFALAGMGARLTSVDISQAQLDTAASRAGEIGLDIAFLRADAVELRELGDESFDLVYTGGHVAVWVSDLKRYYAEACRILRRGGMLMVNEYHPFRRIWRASPDRLELACGYFERLCCKLGEGAMRNQGASCSPYDSALARRSCSHAMASVRAHGPRPKARSTIRASPTMPPWRANIPAWPLRSARITSKPLIVA